MMKYVLIILGWALLVLGAVGSAYSAPQPANPDTALDRSPSTGDGDLPDLPRGNMERTLFRRQPAVLYQRGGHRDPFRALIVDEKKVTEIHTDLLLLEGAVLTGVVWAEGQYLAMVKDKDGRNFFLREGDAIYRGRVTLVTQNLATFETSDFGDYQKVTLKVKTKDKG